MPQTKGENLNVQRAWNTNAEFWDQRMAEGNDFFNLLIWPAVAMMLKPIAGDNASDQSAYAPRFYITFTTNLIPPAKCGSSVCR
jgi:hypothetical protein